MSSSASPARVGSPWLIPQPVAARAVPLRCSAGGRFGMRPARRSGRRCTADSKRSRFWPRRCRPPAKRAREQGRRQGQADSRQQFAEQIERERAAIAAAQSISPGSTFSGSMSSGGDSQPRYSVPTQALQSSPLSVEPAEEDSATYGETASTSCTGLNLLA
jgi:hypothetical protein